MALVTPRYWVRVELTEEVGGRFAYEKALDLALKISKENPGLTVEIAQDKVWSKITTGGSNATQELQDQAGSACGSVRGSGHFG